MIYVNSGDINDVIVNSTDSTISQPAANAREDGSPYSDEDSNQTMTEGQVRLMAYWPTLTDDIKCVKNVDAKNQPLPLARIKKIMKLDDDVKMISAEAPLLFAKAAEIFITELTLRAWVHTEENKRRTLQRNDIAIAIMKYDQFDFLIDIVPRDEVRPPKKEERPEPKANATSGEQVQYYLQMAQQTQSALAGTSNPLQTTQIQQQQLQNLNTTPQQIQLLQGTSLMQTPNMAGQIAIGSPQNILLNMQPHQQHQQIQLVQQIMTPNGEIQHVPIQIPQSQMNVIRMQVQNHQQMGQQQPIIIQTSPMQGQQILQMNSNPQQQQQQQQQQTGGQQTTNMYISSSDDQKPTIF